MSETPVSTTNVNDSILLTIKKMLGIDPAYTAFDTDVTVFINSAMMTLEQIGVGPRGGFTIIGPDETWNEYITDGDYGNFEGVKTYIYARVRLMFDPPTNSFVTTSFQDQIKELEWRLQVQSDRKDAWDAANTTLQY